MKFKISAPIKLLSLNKAFITLPNGRRCRSKEYVQFTREINTLVRLNKKKLDLFEDKFNPKIHALKAELIFYTPNLYTKAGTISKNSGDAANMEKCLIDNILTGKIDDSQILIWNIQKTSAEDYAFSLELEIILR